jgi:hypothetical protein
MSETSLRELLHDAMAGDEPPIRQQLLGSAVRAARRTRRLRFVAAVSAAAVAVPALAFGVPVLAGALGHASTGQHGAASGPSSGRGVKGPAGRRSHGTHEVTRPRHTAASPGNLQFLRPELPAAYADPNPVPITNQSLGQLLIDDMPKGARLSQIQASINANPNGAPVTYRTVYTAFNVVTTRIGAGLVQAQMMVAGASPFDSGCAGEDRAICRNYRLPGGVQVEELYMSGLMVSVFRPNVAQVSVNEANYAMAAGSPETKGMPLTLAQLLKVALDPRWQFTISQSFVQQASGLNVVPYQ